MRHIARKPSEIVPRVAQILQYWWNASAGISVIELLECGCGDFKVVETRSGAPI